MYCTTIFFSGEPLDDSATVLVVSMKSSKALGSRLIGLDTNNNQHILEA